MPTIFMPQMGGEAGRKPLNEFNDADIIFQTNFGNDTDYVHTAAAGNWTVGNDAPSGWHGAKRGTTNQAIRAVNDGGRNGTPSMRFEYSTETNKPLILHRHLTREDYPGDETGAMNNGYQELYVQVVYRFDPDWLWGSVQDPFDALIWKMLRFWSNTHPSNTSGGSIGGWSENRTVGSANAGGLDTRYIIVTMKNSSTVEQIHWNIGCNEATDNNHSAINQDQVKYTWDISGGKTLDGAVAEWHINENAESNPGRFVGYPAATEQDWHVVQWHVKYTAVGAGTGGDGVLECWVDGTNYNITDTECDNDPLTNTDTGYATSGNLCTESESGCNSVLLFDNIQSVTENWSAHKAHWIDVDQVVISTTKIPDDYMASAG